MRFIFQFKNVICVGVVVAIVVVNEWSCKTSYAQKNKHGIEYI